ncbi:hypothetical protein TJA_19190 [Thermus sp. LT1-2-5]
MGATGLSYTDPKMRRFRGVVEGVFGGMKTRLGSGYLLERKPKTARMRALLELVVYAHKIWALPVTRVFLSLLAPPPGYKAIY